MSRQRKTQSYVVLATTARTPAVLKESMLDDVKDQLTKGWITNFVIVCPGIRMRPTNVSFVKLLNDIGHGWAANRIVYQLPDENVKDFVGRICMDYEVTHFVDTRRASIKHVVTEPYLCDVKVYQAKPRNWASVRGWMFKTNPSFYSLVKKANDAFHIIRTGTTMSHKEKM